MDPWDRQAAFDALTDKSIYPIHQLTAYRGQSRDFPCLSAAIGIDTKRKATVDSMVKARLYHRFAPLLYAFPFDRHRVMIAGDAVWFCFWPQHITTYPVSMYLDVFLIDHTVDSATATINAFGDHMRSDYNVTSFRSVDQIIFQIKCPPTTQYQHSMYKVRFSLYLYQTPEQALCAADIATDGIGWYNGRLLLSAAAKYTAETGIVLLNLADRRQGFEQRLTHSILHHNLGIGFPQLDSLPIQRPFHFRYLWIDTSVTRHETLRCIAAKQLTSLLPEKESPEDAFLHAAIRINAIEPTLEFGPLLRTAMQAARIDHWWLRYVLLTTPLHHCWSIVHEYIDCDETNNSLLAPHYGDLSILLGHPRALRYIDQQHHQTPFQSVALLEQLCTERLADANSNAIAWRVPPHPTPVAMSAADWFGTNAELLIV